MEIVFLVLLFLFMVGISNVLVRFIPLPLPLVQVGVGAGLAALPHYGIHVSLDPGLFLLLFIPPLLFSDGWRIPKRELFRERNGVLMLAFGLVFFTVAGAGYFINWLIPAISLPAAFALAAVLSPTDAVAVSAITGRVRVPPRLMHILQGESLLNDASGLVAFKFALAAALTGTFSLKAAATSFVFIAAGGLLTGVVLAFAVGWGRHRIARWRGESAGTHIILTLLLPFAAYMLAEHLGWSGILAAVAAGITMNYTTFTRDCSLETRIQSAAIWGMLEMSFNGIIFLLLGLQLPGILDMARQDAVEAGVRSPWVLLWYVLAIGAALGVLRFLWVWCSLKLALLRAALKRKKLPPAMDWRLVAATSLAGVRGAVTLAGVLSLPLFMPDGLPFPARNLMLFLATGVILVSLFGASFGLPFLLKNLQMPPMSAAAIEERMARRLAIEAAIREIEREREKFSPGQMSDASLRSDLCERIIASFQQKLAMLDDDESASEPARHAFGIEKQLRLSAVRAERARLNSLYQARQINDQTLDALVKDVDMREAALSGANIGHF
ncbi:MAG: Na+/H+ antiporter [Opitutaceae bacterium]|nr:Na+/H+ antiporter [Opitutaceae bacterium]